MPYRPTWSKKTFLMPHLSFGEVGEDFFESVCDSLGAKLVYNAGMQWQLDDWLFAAMGEYKSLLKQAKRAASSWGHQEAAHEYEELDSFRTQTFTRTHAEQWAINANVHFNSWGEYV